MTAPFNLLVCAAFIIAASASFEDCGTNIKTLEHALYGTGDNVFQFNLVFFPPSMLTSRFIRVRYAFLNEQDEDDGGCTVSFVWAIGGFLFFQPPAIFTLTSLFFSFPNNNLESINLTLPYECRALVQANRTAECSCSGDSQSLRLDILTQQVNIYAKYESQGAITREATYARAVCSEEIDPLFYSSRHGRFHFVISCMTILLPAFSFLVLMVSIRNVSNEAIQSFTHPSKHGLLVGLVFTGAAISTGILLCDILACIVVVTGSHEYANDIEGRPINLYIVFVTLVLDGVFSLPLLLSMLYVTIFFNGRRIFKKLCCDVTCTTVHPSLSSVISFLVGRSAFDKVSRNGVIPLVVPLMLMTPLMCISSHIGYIVVAFLTEPYKAVSIFLLYYFILVYLVFSFRKCYTNYSKVNFMFTGRKKVVRGHDDVRGHVNIEMAATKQSSETVEEEDTVTVKGKSLCCCTYSEAENTDINTQTFCLLIFYGIFIIAVAVMFVSIFVLLPIVVENLAVYFFQILQLVVVLVSTQIAYQLFISGSFNFEGIVEKFKEVYARKGCNEKLVSIAQQKDEKLQDVTGEFAAEFTDLVIDKLQEWLYVYACIFLLYVHIATLYIQFLPEWLLLYFSGTCLITEKETLGQVLVRFSSFGG